ncbi:MAG: hypothetical protein QNL80_14180 [Akkermansiaceae bacterium]
MRLSLIFFLLNLLPLAAKDDAIVGAALPPTGALPEPEVIPGDGLFSDQAAPSFTLPKFVRSTQVDFDYIAGNLTLVYSGNVVMDGKDGSQAFADRAVLNEKDRVITITGDVSIYQNGIIFRGDSAIYRLDQKKFDTEGLRAGMGPILLEAGRFRSVQTPNGVAYVGENSGITTHDVENPHWWLRADRTSIFPGDRVVFKNLKLYAGDTPIFWLPYLSQQLDAELGYHVVPGARSNLGFFLKNSYGLMIGGERDPITGANDSAWILSQWHVDLYSRRGLGTGISLFDTRVDDEDDFGHFKFYYINDLAPSVERSGIPRGYLNEDRYRVELAHRRDLWKTQRATYSVEADLTWLSDAFYLEDFDTSLYNTNPEPDNTLAVTRRNDQSLATFGARMRINDFYQSDTRLPEFTFDWIRQPLLDTPFFYESQTSLGIYREHLADLNSVSLRTESLGLVPGDSRLTEINRLLSPHGFNRFHSYHELSRPIKVGFLNITPKVGGSFTNYSSIKGPDDSQSRSLFYTGIDSSLKFTKSYPEWINDKWGLNGALHVVEPYASFSFVSTNELDQSFYGIDRLTPSTRSRPLNVGRFSAIDDLQNWSILRLGARNRIMTHQDGSTQDWLSVNTYLNVFFDDPEFSRNFSNLYNEIRWSPLPWFDLEFDTQIPLFEDSNFLEVATTGTVMPTENIEMSLRYRYLNYHPILRDSNRIELELYSRLSEKWGIGTEHRWEIEDGTLELQAYSLYYDFDSWVGSVGFFHRDNSIEDDYGLLLSLGLKEIPKLSLPVRIGTE